MSATEVSIYARQIDVDLIRTADYAVRLDSDIVSTRLGDDVKMQGTLDEMLAVIGRAHEQLLAIRAARIAAASEETDG